MVSFTPMDQHFPNPIATFQTYSYRCLMYTRMCRVCLSFTKAVRSKWNPLSFPSLIPVFAASYTPFGVHQTSQTRNQGVTLTGSSHALQLIVYQTVAKCFQLQPPLWIFTSCKSLLICFPELTTFHFTIGSRECHYLNISVDSALPELSMWSQGNSSVSLSLRLPHPHSCERQFDVVDRSLFQGRSSNPDSAPC